MKFLLFLLFPLLLIGLNASNPDLVQAFRDAVSTDDEALIKELLANPDLSLMKVAGLLPRRMQVHLDCMFGVKMGRRAAFENWAQRKPEGWEAWLEWAQLAAPSHGFELPYREAQSLM
jgi:hypothetical protein